MNIDVSKLVRKKRRKKAIKRLVLGIFVLVIGIIIFIYKAPIFNLKKIYFEGLVTIANENLQEELKYNIGKNIFTIDYNKIKEDLIQNPYIKEVKINKSGINSIKINVTENNIAYYVMNNEKIEVINSEGIIVEEVLDISDRNLTNISGVDLSEKVVGDKIYIDEEVPIILDTFYKMIEVIPEEFKIKEINILDVNNIVCYVGDIEIRLGDSSDILNKMNIALNLIEQKAITKGYIDLGFNGPPVIKQIN